MDFVNFKNRHKKQTQIIASVFVSAQEFILIRAPPYPVIIVSVHSKLNIVLRFFLVQKANTLDVARGNKIDTHFLRLFVRSGQKNISTGILQFCQLTGTYLRVFDHKSLSNVCSQLLCVRGNMSTGWKLSLSNRCRISSFFEMKK